MFQLLQQLAGRDIVFRQFPSFSLAFLIASLFYRFGSFALESIAFLITWFVIDAAFEAVTYVVKRSRSARHPLATDRLSQP